MDTVVLVVRELNVVMGLAAFFWLLFRSAKHWGEYEFPIQAYTMALLFYAFAAAYSSGESIAQGSPAGLRSAFILVANLSLLLALWKTRGQYAYGHRPG